MKDIYKTFALILIMMVSAGSQVQAQLSGNNLLQYQLGNIPQVKPYDYSTLYDQANLQYRYENLTGRIKLEHFFSPGNSTDYTRLTQFRLGYATGDLDLKLGHFYETFGRGMLLRTYDIKGSVYEDRAFRVQHGFYKNLLGASATYARDNFRVKAVRGRMLSNLFPPGFDDDQRWADLLEGIEAVYSLKKQNIGLSYLRNHLNGAYTHFGSLTLNGSLPQNISYYLEWAQQLHRTHDLFDGGDDSRYGFYGNLNYSYQNVGLLLEYKDYQDFLIGTGINEPPALVKEHGYKLLNRSTHIPQLIHESGYQVEIYYFFDNGHTLTLNNTRLVNKLYRKFTFTEYFLGYDFPVSEKHTFRTFIDYGEEGIELVDNRITSGINWDYYLGNYWSSLFELEYQQYEKGKASRNVTNYLTAISVARSNKLNAGIILEWSNDVNLSDDPKTREIEEGTTLWPGLNVAYWYKAHRISLFAGKRRGGPACASGICYEVLDFRGVELRLLSQF